MADSSPDPRILPVIEIETPCPIPWDEIQGAGPVRHCQVCRKSVFDLIELTTVAAAEVLNNDETLPCVRICRSPDGQILTADNPARIGLRIWRKLRRRSGWAASLFALLFLPGCGWLNSRLSYGAPARSIKSTDLGRTISEDSARPKGDTVEAPAPSD